MAGILTRIALAPAGNPGCGKHLFRSVKNGDTYKFHIVSRFHGYKVDKADPFAFHTETSAAHGVESLGSRLHLGRFQMDVRSGRTQQHPGADVDL